jgi:hypothetical protein
MRHFNAPKFPYCNFHLNHWSRRRPSSFSCQGTPLLKATPMN